MTPNNTPQVKPIARQLSFCSILIISPRIVEVILNEGVEITGDMVDEFFQVVGEEMDSEISVLLNKVTKYSYRFDALMKLSPSTKIRNIGVVTYDSLAASTSKFMMDRFNTSNKNVQLFHAREDALQWLQSL